MKGPNDLGEDTSTLSWPEGVQMALETKMKIYAGKNTKVRSPGAGSKKYSRIAALERSGKYNSTLSAENQICSFDP